MKLKQFAPPCRVLAVVCLALLGACQKEKINDLGMQLEAEGFGGGQKAAVSGNAAYWIEGETVRINGADYTVRLSGSTAYVQNVPEADSYRALYPNTLNSTATLDGNTLTVSIPDAYTYRESDGRQALDLPMAAYGTSDSRLVFRHLTAAVTVEVVNHYGFTIEVDSVVVSSNAYQLSGDKAITIGATPDVAAATSTIATERRVKVAFDGGSALQVLSGQTKQVQVPVLPVGSDNRFTVEVRVHKVDEAEVSYLFQRTQGDGGSGYALTRAQMGYAPATVGGVFSVAADRQVIISQGNLQYQASTGTWRFAQHQIDCFGSSTSGGNRSAEGERPTQEKWIDLFGWGTSGWGGSGATYYQPYIFAAIGTGASHGPTGAYDLTGEYANADWGVYNPISNGGNQAGLWRTLTKDECEYLLSTRSDGWTKATINGTKGLLLLPDGYEHPEGVTALPETMRQGNASFSVYEIADANEWYRMQAVGAIFLPNSGYMGNGSVNWTEGFYWFSTTFGSDKAYLLQIKSSSVDANAYSTRNCVRAVRLVKTI